MSTASTQTNIIEEPSSANAASLQTLQTITTNIEDALEQYAEVNDSRVKSLTKESSTLKNTITGLEESCKLLKNRTDDVEAKNKKIALQKQKQPEDNSLLQ